MISAAILFVPQLHTAIDNFQPLESVFSQIGATYGTILALVLTLSLIPIQRAAEVWSSSIVRLYRRDPVTYLTFMSLGVCCTASFLLSVRGLLLVPVSVLMVLSLTALALNLDLLRWYHGHVCRLLDPDHAVGLASEETKRVINRTATQVTRISKLQHDLLDAEQKREVSVEAIESAIYPQMPGYPSSINSWISDLAEIGIKAVTRGEKLLAKTAVYSIADLTKHYLSVRKNNLTLSPAPEAMFLAMTSDVSVVTEHVYDVLHEVSHVAVAQGDEASAIRVTEAYQAIGVHTAHLGAPVFRGGTAPLTHSPIFYALMCIKNAQSKGLEEIPFQGARILSKVAATAPKDIDPTDIHIPVIDGLAEIATYLYTKGSYGLAEEVNGHQFNILTQLLQRKDHFLDEVLQRVLEKIATLVPFAIISEMGAGRLSTIRPLGKAYENINPNSLGNLFELAAATLPELDEERNWINPYRDLIAFAEIISHHLRRVAENNEFGESFLLWGINQSIKKISMVIAKIVEQPLRRERGDEDDLVDKMSSLLAFYWVAFHGKKTVSALRANDCCKSLVSIGLHFLEQGRPEVLKTCISNIRSIVDSYCEIAKPADPYAIGDLFAHLWGIRMVLNAMGYEALTQEVDEALTRKSRGLSNADKEAIVLRRQQLEDRLERRDYLMGRLHDDEYLLHRLLRKAAANADRTAGSRNEK